MEKNKFFVLSAQCSMFFDPMLSIDNDTKIELSSKLIKELDGDPTMLPIPLDAPPDIPRLQINSKDKKFAYGISLKRSDVNFNEVGEPKETLDNIVCDLFKHEEQLLKMYKEDKDWNISRLAFIVNYVMDLGESASKYISKKFILDNPNYDSAELHLLKKNKIDAFDVNRWFRIKCVDLKENVLNLLVDVNTVPEKKLNLPVKDMMGFYVSLVSYLDDEIKNLFGV